MKTSLYRPLTGVQYRILGVQIALALATFGLSAGAVAMSRMLSKPQTRIGDLFNLAVSSMIGAGLIAFLAVVLLQRKKQIPSTSLQPDASSPLAPQFRSAHRTVLIPAAVAWAFVFIAAAFEIVHDFAFAPANDPRVALWVRAALVGTALFDFLVGAVAAYWARREDKIAKGEKLGKGDGEDGRLRKREVALLCAVVS